MEKVKRITPWDAFNRFFEDLTFADICWLAIAGALVYGFYWISTKQLNRKKSGWQAVLFWIAMFGGCIFCYFVFGMPRIEVGGASSFFFLGLTAVISFISVIACVRKGSDWVKIIYGTFVIVIGFSTAITFALGAHSFSYAIIFGFFAGGSTAMIVQTARRLNSQDDTSTPNVSTGMEEDAVKKEWDFSKTTKA